MFSFKMANGFVKAAHTTIPRSLSHSRVQRPKSVTADGKPTYLVIWCNCVVKRRSLNAVYQIQPLDIVISMSLIYYAFWRRHSTQCIYVSYDDGWDSGKRCSLTATQHHCEINYCRLFVHKRKRPSPVRWINWYGINSYNRNNTDSLHFTYPTKERIVFTILRFVVNCHNHFLVCV